MKCTLKGGCTSLALSSFCRFLSKVISTTNNFHRNNTCTSMLKKSSFNMTGGGMKRLRGGGGSKNVYTPETGTLKKLLG